MHSARAMATRCCCPPDSWAGVFVRLLGDLYPTQVGHRLFLSLGLGGSAHPDRRQGQVLQYRQVREEVERLEHHSDLAADRVQCPRVVGQLRAIHHNAAGLVHLQPVDAADHRRFARP
jgi:hypothetical protein